MFLKFYYLHLIMMEIEDINVFVSKRDYNIEYKHKGRCLLGLSNLKSKDVSAGGKKTVVASI